MDKHSPAAVLYRELRGMGVRLRAEDDRLRFHPRSAVAPEMLDRIKANKPELLAYIRDSQTTVCEDSVCRGGDLYFELFASMSREDLQYLRTKPKPFLPPHVTGTLLLDAWPLSEQPISFGQYKGRRLGDLAQSEDGRRYLKWCLRKGAGTPEFRDAARTVLNETQKGVS